MNFLSAIYQLWKNATGCKNAPPGWKFTPRTILLRDTWSPSDFLEKFGTRWTTPPHPAPPPLPSPNNSIPGTRQPKDSRAARIFAPERISLSLINQGKRGAALK